MVRTKREADLEAIAERFDEIVSLTEAALVEALSHPDAAERRRAVAWIRRDLVPALAIDPDAESRASSQRTLSRLIVERRPPDGGREKSDFRNAVFHAARLDMRRAYERDRAPTTTSTSSVVMRSIAALALLSGVAAGAIWLDRTARAEREAITGAADLPPGFVLVEPTAAALNDLPPGAVLDELPPGSVLRSKGSPTRSAVQFTPGVQSISTELPLVAPLRIETAPGADYFAKLVRVPGGLTVMTMLIRGGQPIEIECPLGTYRLRYASGAVWQGERELFGANTFTAEADADLTFEEGPEGISGYTIELIQQVGGNLDTDTIPRERF